MNELETFQPDDDKPLKISCSSTACEVGQHYYGPSRRRKRSNYPVGTCADCGEHLVDWKRVHNRSSADADYVFDMLRTECWRHEWWHKEFDPVAVNHARRKGRRGLREAAVARIRSAVGRPAGSWDSTQTAKKGNVLFYAQHATGTCCRKCIQYWHGIPQDRRLSEEEIEYLAGLLPKYVDICWPELNDEPVYVPPRRGRKESV